MRIRIEIDDLSTAEVQELVAEHLAGMHSNSPPGHVNALAIQGLRKPEVTFWVARIKGQLGACGALKELDASSGEVKSMRTRPAYLRQGVGQAILEEIIRTARARGYTRLYLETGTGQGFAAAHAFYQSNAFTRCDAFGDYPATAFNLFMVRAL
jgi:putative acetyltransferase